MSVSSDFACLNLAAETSLFLRGGESPYETELNSVASGEESSSCGGRLLVPLPVLNTVLAPPIFRSLPVEVRVGMTALVGVKFIPGVAWRGADAGMYHREHTAVHAHRVLAPVVARPG